MTGLGTVLVTGARRGIGRSIAERLAADGWQVVVSDLELVSLDDTVRSIRRSGGTVHPVACDNADREAVQRMAEEVQDHLGSVTALVNNAALILADASVRDTDLLNVDDDLWEASWRVNVRGTVNVIRSFLPGMLEARSGTIVNVVSMLGIVPIGGVALSYSVSKAALIQLTKHVAATYGDRGIRCNAVAPGSILTEAQRELYDDAELNRKLESYPSTRLGEPEDIAAAVAYLLSDGAGFVNGHVLTVDGGVTNRLRL